MLGGCASNDFLLEPTRRARCLKAEVQGVLREQVDEVAFFLLSRLQEHSRLLASTIPPFAILRRFVYLSGERSEKGPRSTRIWARRWSASHFRETIWR